MPLSSYAPEVIRDHRERVCPHLDADERFSSGPLGPVCDVYVRRFSSGETLSLGQSSSLVNVSTEKRKVHARCSGSGSVHQSLARRADRALVLLVHFRGNRATDAPEAVSPAVCRCAWLYRNWNNRGSCDLRSGLWATSIYATAAHHCFCVWLRSTLWNKPNEQDPTRGKQVQQSVGSIRAAGQHLNPKPPLHWDLNIR